MLHCPSRRNHPYAIAIATAADTKQIHTLFAVVLTIVDLRNAKWIAKRRNRFVERNAVIANVKR
jgi:hypothetical protein